MTEKLAHCLDAFWQAAAPRRALTVSAWADEHRELSGKQAVHAVTGKSFDDTATVDAE